ncbi:LysM peptidoglycan-binding domain-containing protein [Heliobacterium undosum]|uniref:LysM peptidoglycan-binding domain-containing protein n=1 Tax=Heliomicrobium undosum TaxID=121734 RepID=A0A845L195_9FIRM|nr:NlpC/P60 family protein [Heliomicrobium undosum]MZP28564.1 LysM peptidoglycan-binding domain-containing protein [Heliomicrobium undosum]
MNKQHDKICVYFFCPIVLTMFLISVPNQAFADDHTYTVKSGDTLWSISQHAGVSVNKFIEANPQLKNPNSLKIGQLLNLPIQQKSKTSSTQPLSPSISAQTAMQPLPTSNLPQNVMQPIQSAQSANNDERQKIINALVSTGKKLLGKPYKYGAKSMTPTAFDCSSFTQYVYGVNHIQLNRTAAQQSIQGKSVEKAQLRSGDLVFFWNSDTQNKKGIDRIGHVGIYLSEGKFLHCSTLDKGVIISDMNDKYYSKTFICARRVIM